MSDERGCILSVIGSAHDDRLNLLDAGETAATETVVVREFRLPVEIAHVAVQHSHLVCCDSLGGLWAWGNNSYGQLGFDPKSVQYVDIVRASTRHADADRCHAHGRRLLRPRRIDTAHFQTKQLAAGPAHTLCVSGIARAASVWESDPCVSAHSLCISIADDGKCYAFGLGDSGRCALAHASFEPQAIQLDNASSAIRLCKAAAGDAHSLVLDTNGNVYAFGMNDQGQLGVGKAVREVWHPTRLEALHRVQIHVVDIVCGPSYSAAITGT